VRTSSLSQLADLAYHRPASEVKIKYLLTLECIDLKRDLGWNWFGLGVADFYIFNDGVNQSMMGKLIRHCIVS
jgi:hypothetical protein